MDNPENAQDGAPSAEESTTAAQSVTLPAQVEEVLSHWWSATVQTVGPLVSTEAYNALSAARDNLRTQLAAALR